MTYTNEGATMSSTFRNSVEHSLKLDVGVEMEIHSAHGYVVTGVLDRVVWINSEIEAVIINAKPGYQRVIRWAHVVEVRSYDRKGQ